MTPQEWLIYQNQNATRNDPLHPSLVSALSFVPELGVQMHVISGGQEAAGQGGSRTGSTRHDHGMAADVDFYKDGRKLDWDNPSDMPILVEIVKRSKAAGVSGIGAGDDYMGAGRFHLGFGNPGVWGAGGKGANAPDWLREAYGLAPLGTTPQPGPTIAAANALSGPTAPAQPAPNQLAAQEPPQWQYNAFQNDPMAFMRMPNALARQI